VSRISVFGWAGGSGTAGAGCAAEFFDRDLPIPVAGVEAPGCGWSAGCVFAGCSLVAGAALLGVGVLAVGSVAGGCCAGAGLLVPGTGV